MLVFELLLVEVSVLVIVCFFVLVSALVLLSSVIDDTIVSQCHWCPQEFRV